MAEAHMLHLLLHSSGKLEGRTRSQTTEAAASQWNNSNMDTLSQKGKGVEKGKKSEGNFPSTGIFSPRRGIQAQNLQAQLTQSCKFALYK